MLSSENRLTSVLSLVCIWVFLYLQRGRSLNSLQDQELRQAEINCLWVCSLVIFLHELCFLLSALCDWRDAFIISNTEVCRSMQLHARVRGEAERLPLDRSCISAGTIPYPEIPCSLDGLGGHLHLCKAISVSTSCPDTGRGCSTL